MMQLIHLKWDSDFFGFNVAQIVSDHVFDNDVEESILKLYHNSCKLVYYFTLPQTPVPDEKQQLLNGKLVDKKTFFKKNISTTLSPVSEKVVHYTAKQMDKRLIDLSLSSGAHSRFKIDKNFPKGSFERLYTLWIQRSVSGEIADYVLVYQENDEIYGLVTLKVYFSNAVIGLLSVNQNVQGKGVGRSLIHGIEKVCMENGINILLVATQGDNTSACQFYLKTGFQILKQELVYHFWHDHENPF